MLLFDVIVIARDPHEPTIRECAIALGVYVGAAIAFGVWIWISHGHDYGGEFYAGWLTEYSLSIDNLFVFIILMAALRVPREYQQEALMVGIILALVFRAIFIALGLPADRELQLDLLPLRRVPGLHRGQAGEERPSDEDEHPEDNRMVAFAQTHLNVGEEWHGLKLAVNRTASASSPRC